MTFEQLITEAVRMTAEQAAIGGRSVEVAFTPEMTTAFRANLVLGMTQLGQAITSARDESYPRLEHVRVRFHGGGLPLDFQLGAAGN